MNTIKLMAITALAVSGSVFADPTGETVDFSDFQSTRTRAEVQAELAQVPDAQRFAQSEAVDPASFQSATAASATPAMCMQLTQEFANSQLARNDEVSSSEPAERSTC